MIVGTAGHVDHGKTALIRALTGVDTDRLADEKRRGISIDLGFAYLPAPDDDVIGFVDVPGHEQFLHNMLAGATGIDFALLVVAADDGIKPQTLEHLAIIDLLGITRGVVALSKIDLVTPERRVSVKREIEELLRDTKLAGADIIETSPMTGTGIETLRARLFAAATQPAFHDIEGRFRLAVDRCFTLRGAGTVVTGTVLSGTVAVGDRVVISPSGHAARVRSIHAQNRPAEHGIAGQRCALNLAGNGVTKDAVTRGDMVLDPTLHAPTIRIDVRLKLLASETKPVDTWLPVRLHHGAAALGARLVPLGAPQIRPGEEALAQLVLERPIAAAWGDRFILRDTSARRTIGGGWFIDLRAPARRRRTPERLAQLEALSQSDPAGALAQWLNHSPYYIDLGVFLRDRALPTGHAADLAACLDLTVLVVGDTIIGLSPPGWRRLQESIVAALTAFHAAHPGESGMAPERLRRAVTPRLSAPLLASALDALARRQKIVLSGGLVCLPAHETRLDAAQRALWARIEPLLSGQHRFQPPRLAEMVTTLGIGTNELRRVLKLAAHLDWLEEVTPDHFFRRDAIAEIVAMLPAIAAESADGQFAAAQLRDRLGGGRKAAIEILEFLDRHGVTVRRGDLRRLDPRRRDRFNVGEGTKTVAQLTETGQT